MVDVFGISKAGFTSKIPINYDVQIGELARVLFARKIDSNRSINKLIVRGHVSYSG